MWGPTWFSHPTSVLNLTKFSQTPKWRMLYPQRRGGGCTPYQWQWWWHNLYRCHIVKYCIYFRRKKEHLWKPKYIYFKETVFKTVTARKKRFQRGGYVTYGSMISSTRYQPISGRLFFLRSVKYIYTRAVYKDTPTASPQIKRENNFFFKYYII